MAILVGRNTNDYPELISFLSGVADCAECEEHHALSIETLIWDIVNQPIQSALKLIIYRNSLSEVEPIQAQKDRFEAMLRSIESCVFATTWIDDPEKIWNRFYSFTNMEKMELLLLLGDYYFDREQLNLSLKYYKQCCTISELKGEPNNLKTEDLIRYTKALCNLGLIYCYGGKIAEGIDFIEKAHRLYPSHRILVTLLRCKIEFFDIDLRLIEEQYIYRLLTDHDDEILNFLVWFFNRKEDYEESITSYMQISPGLAQLRHLKYYVKYMITTEQTPAITRFLEPLRNRYPIHYYVGLIQSYLALNAFESARSTMNEFEGKKVYELWKKRHFDRKTVDSTLREIDEYATVNFDTYLLIKTKLQFLEKQIILSIESINLIYPENLTNVDRIEYHLQLAALSKVSSYIMKEQEQYREILLFLKDRYRRILLNT